MTVQVTRAMARGLRNHNPGNIERQSGDPRFVVFAEPKWGIRAICRVLITYQDGRQARDGSRIDSVREIVERWAPPGENDTKAYVAAVAKAAGRGPDDPVDVYDWATMRAIVVAIIGHENGCQPYDDATLDAGLIAAGLQAPARLVRHGPSKVAKYAGVAAGAVASAGSTVLSVAPDLVQTLPAARASYEQTTAGLAPVVEAVPWLRVVVIVAGLIAMAATLYLAAQPPAARAGGMSEARRHDGETLGQAVDRLGDDLEDPFDRHRGSRGRHGWRDLLGGHALVNVVVAWCRERPRTAGHVLAYALVGLLAGAAAGLAWALAR